MVCHWAFSIMEQWFIQLVTGVYKWLYESIVYGISYDIYECFMFMNSCISQWSGIGYLHLWMVVFMKGYVNEYYME